MMFKNKFLWCEINDFFLEFRFIDTPTDMRIVNITAFCCILNILALSFDIQNILKTTWRQSQHSNNERCVFWEWILFNYK